MDNVIGKREMFLQKTVYCAHILITPEGVCQRRFYVVWIEARVYMQRQSISVYTHKQCGLSML